MLFRRPGPSSTDKGFPVRSTGSPTITPAAGAHVSIAESRVDNARDIYLTRLFVHLDGCLVAADPNDFAHKLVMANFHLFDILATSSSWMDAEAGPYQLVHGNTSHVFGDDHGSKCFALAIAGGLHCLSLVAAHPETE
jgi:hypothetical protein